MPKFFPLLAVYFDKLRELLRLVNNEKAKGFQLAVNRHYRESWQGEGMCVNYPALLLQVGKWYKIVATSVFHFKYSDSLQTYQVISQIEFT